MSCDHSEKGIQKVKTEKDIHSTCDFVTGRGISFRTKKRIIVDSLVVKVYLDKKLIKICREKLNTSFNSVQKNWEFSWSGDTISPLRSYTFQLKQASSIVYQFNIDRISIESTPVYNGSICDFVSFHFNGEKKNPNAGVFELW